MVARAYRVGDEEEVAPGTSETRLLELLSVLVCIILVEIVNLFVPRIVSNAISWLSSWI